VALTKASGACQHRLGRQAAAGERAPISGGERNPEQVALDRHLLDQAPPP